MPVIETPGAHHRETTPEGILTPSGRVPYPRRLRVAGTFTLGLYEFDTTMGFVTLETAERLFAKDSADLIQLRAKSSSLDEIRRTIEKYQQQRGQ